MSKMYVLLQSVHVSGAQTSQLASLQDAHYVYVSTAPYSVARHPETRVPPRPRCRCCCCRCRCWTGRRRSSRRCKMSLAGQCHAAVLSRRARRDARPCHVQDVKSQLASLQDEHCRSVSTTPYSVAGHTETRIPATSKMWVLLQSVHVLDGQTAQLTSLQDNHCRSVSTTPYSVAGHADTHVPATSEVWVLLQPVRVLDGPTSQLVSLQDEHCRSVSTTPYSVAGHAETHVPATSKM